MDNPVSAPTAYKVTVSKALAQKVRKVGVPGTAAIDKAVPLAP